MGTTTLFEVITTDQDARDAFKTLVEQSRDEYGHRYDSGSFASAGALEHVDSTPKTRHEAEQHYVRYFDSPGWYDRGCSAVAVCAHTEVRKKVTLTFPGDEWDDSYGCILDALREKFGNDVTGFERLSKPNVTFRKPKVDVPDDPATNVFQVMQEGRVVGKPFPTQAAARAAAVELAQRTTAPLTVRCVRMRGDSPDLLTVTPVVAKVTIEVEAVIHRPDPKRKHIGWAFYGWSKC